MKLKTVLEIYAVLSPAFANALKGANNAELNNLSTRQSNGYSNCDAIKYTGIESHNDGHSTIAVCKSNVECQAADELTKYCSSLTVSTAIPSYTSTVNPTATITNYPANTTASDADCSAIGTAAEIFGFEKNGNILVCKTAEQCIQADLYAKLCQTLTVSTAITSYTSTVNPTPTPSQNASPVNKIAAGAVAIPVAIAAALAF